jgi:histidinol-phosphate aminotransferase
MITKVEKMLSRRAVELLRTRVRYPFAREYGAGIAGAINLSSNESPLGPSPSVIRAIRREAERVGSYPDPKAEELKKEISRYVGVDEKCVVLGNGSDELIDMLCKAFLDQGDVAIVPLPTFSMYEIFCRVNGGTPKFVELRNFEWDSDSLVAAMSGAKLAFIARPNNPTGNGIDDAGLEQLLALGKPVVVDEAYAEFAGRSVARQAQARDDLIVLRTFSKAFGMAGLRIGYAVVSPRIAEVLEEIRPPFNVNRLAQVAAIAALRDRQYLRKVIDTVRAGRNYLSKELSKLGARVLPSDANFIMVDVTPLGCEAPELCDYLARNKILVRDLSGFRGAGARWVRITIGTTRQNRKLVLALKKFKGGG